MTTRGILLGLCLFSAACFGDGGEDEPILGGAGGGSSYSVGSSGGASSTLDNTVGDAQESAPAGVGGQGGVHSECLPSVPVDVPVSWSQDRRLAVGQFLSATLSAGPVRQPALLEPSLVTPHLEDLGAELPLDAHIVSTGETHQLRVAAGAEQTVSDSKVHLVVLVDVSPSNARTIPVRNGVLNALADGVDATADTFAPGTLSIVSFAATSAVLVEGAPAGSARSQLDTARASLATAEGHVLSEALKIASGLPSVEGESFRHLLLLTDAGFVADSGTLDQIRELTSTTALSVAQLATIEPGQPTPELRREFLEALVADGRGATFFFSDPAQAVPGALCEDCVNDEVVSSFSRWFAPHQAVEGVTLSLPAGVAPVTDDGASGGGGKALLSPGFSLKLELDLSVACFQPSSTLGVAWPAGAAPATQLPLTFDEATLAIAGSEGRLAANDRLVRLFAELRSSEPDCSVLQDLSTEAQADACAEGDDSRSCRFSSAVLQWIEGAVTSYCP